MRFLIAVLVAVTFSLSASAAVVFSVRGDSVDARYSTSGKTPLLIYKSDDTAPASEALVAAGVFGSSVISFNSGTWTQVKELFWPSFRNFSATSRFAILMRIVPGFTSGAISKQQGLFYAGSSRAGGNNGSYLALEIQTDSTITFTLRDRVTPTDIDSNASGAFAFAEGVPTDIMVVWDDGASPKLKWSQDGVEISTASPAGSSFGTRWSKWPFIKVGGRVDDNANPDQGNFKLNELVIWDTAESHTYATRSTFITASAFDGQVNTSAGAGNIRSGTTEVIAGQTITGTAAIPSAANVRSGTAVDATVGSLAVPVAGDVRNGSSVDATTGTLVVPSVGDVRNGTSVDNTAGTLVVPSAGEVKIGVVYDGATAGTYVASERYTDPGVTNVAAGVAYKFNSTSNNRTGELLKIVLGAGVLLADSVSVGADSVFITQGDGPISLRTTYKADGTALSITGATFETYFPKEGGGWMKVANSAHSIIESGASNVGTADIALTSDQTKLIKAGRAIRFYTIVTLSGAAVRFWGTAKEVRSRPAG